MNEQSHRMVEMDSAEEVAELRARLAEAEETLEAIRTGAVDALIVSGPDTPRVFSLEGAETPYRELVELINEGALLLKPDGMILYANARFAELAGTPLEEVISSPWQRFFDPRHRARLTSLLLAARTSGVKQEFELQRSGGPAWPVEVSVAVVKHGADESFCVIVTDLAERKRAELALRRSHDDLEDRVRVRTAALAEAQAQLSAHAAELEQLVAQRTVRLQEVVAELEHFSYAIVHDMRAPLRAMQGFSRVLEEEFADGLPLAKDYCRRIRLACMRLDRLITDSFNFSKAMLEPVIMHPVDLGQLLTGILDTYPNLQPDKADIEIAPALPVVLGNEAGLTQCFSNLLGNAVKFAKPGQKPQIRVWAEEVRSAELGVRNGEETTASTDSLEGVDSALPTPHSAFIRVWVEDKGIGIPTDAHDRIFGMFQRASNVGEGTGIGLAIVWKVVRRMEGQVGVESAPGQGSRFWVDLKPAG